MVSFKDFILVENQKNFDVEKFYADCKPFIQKIRGINERYLPKHGTKAVPGEWEIKRVMRREKSRDTPIELHNAIDNYFETRFGWRARSESIFTTGDYETAGEHGYVFLCFPIGENFQTLWGEGIEDLYHWLYFKKKILQTKFDKPIYALKDELPKIMPSLIEKTIMELKKVRWHYNDMLKEGYESGSEVLINANNVYLIRMYTEEQNKIINHLKSLGLVFDWWWFKK